MSNLDEVYGDNFQNDAEKSQQNSLINNIANNIAHRQFNFRLFDYSKLWGSEKKLPENFLKNLTAKIKNINDKMILHHIDKKSNAMNMFKELIIDTPVEYFQVIDIEYNKSYFIYITPYEVAAF